VSAVLDHIGVMLDTIAKQTDDTIATLGSQPPFELKVLSMIDVLIRRINDWYAFYASHHPEFAQRIPTPYKNARDKLAQLRSDIHKSLKPRDHGPDILAPFGRYRLAALLTREMIAYTPEELADAFHKEVRTCQFELDQTAKSHGWQDGGEALRAVKADSVKMGRQHMLVSLFVAEYARRTSSMVTIPRVLLACWRPFMQTADARRRCAFTQGAQDMHVAYPAVADDAATSAAIRRANNEHSTRAAICHEAVPGHLLQNYMSAIHAPQRRVIGRTACHYDGWAFYWETLLRRDARFKKSAELLVATIAWRARRFARAAAALEYHMGRIDRAGVVAALVVAGDEPCVAEAEADGALGGGEAGVVGAIGAAVGERQFWALREERVAVEGLAFDERAFHDRVLRESFMPVELLRCIMNGERVGLQRMPVWRFLPGTEWVQQGDGGSRPT
jgi:uncharacterized protein (DUF885 family)